MTMSGPADVRDLEVDMNEEQIEVIRHTDGPCAVMACSGSGKTRSLVHRVARMVRDGIDPKSILAVTFSKNAAKEMNNRLDSLGVTEARIGTWHSLCLQILREDETKWSNWEIDEKDKYYLLVKEALGFKYLNWTSADPRKVNRYIGLCKANLEMPGSKGAIDRATERQHEAYYIAQKLAEQLGMLTFDDFLVFAHRHLSSSEEVRKRWASKWNYILCDESQDSNLVQNEIGKLLAKDHRNYMVVGDFFQAIYSFRGSSPDFLLNFKEDWDAKLVLMNRNYRSGSSIVEAANKIIGAGSIKPLKDMLAERGTESAIHVVYTEQPEDEARELITWTKQIVEADGGKFSDMAVLFRTNAQSRAPEEALLRAQIPYTVVGGGAFYDRREVKNLVAYLRVATGNGKDDDVRRCINAPFRFLGTAFVDRVLKASEASAHPVDWRGIVREVAQQSGIQSRQRASVDEWVSIIEDVGEMAKVNAGKVLTNILFRTKYVDWLVKDDGQETVENSHVENVRELVRIGERVGDVNQFIAYVAEMNSAALAKKKVNKYGNQVVLMSIHKSKGLQFNNVFLCGLQDGLLPHKNGDLEEERRLMYVAVTRARDAITLGCSHSRPSTFLRDAGLS